jgi:hypothetical protein
MLSTIVFCEDRRDGPARGDLAEVLARTLASLVTAKVEGVLCDVRIAGPAGIGLGTVANHAGCGLVEADTEANWLHLALEAARGPLVFLLRCGLAPEPGFIEEANEFLATEAKSKSRAAGLRAAPESLAERLFPSLAPLAGLIAPRDLMRPMPCDGFKELARQVAPATIFHTRARRIG